MLYSKLSYTNLGSSTNLPAHWEGGARARFLNVAVKKFSRPREDGSAGGGWGEACRAVRANTERGQSRRPARSEQNPAKKFSFHFRRKNPARANQEKRRMFDLAASVSERRRAGFIRRVFPENAFGFRSGCGAKLKHPTCWGVLVLLPG